MSREKLDSSRLESLTDSEEAIAELQRRHDREKKMLLEDNRKLLADLETVGLKNYVIKYELLV